MSRPSFTAIMGLCALVLVNLLPSPAPAQEVRPPEDAVNVPAAPDRSATGGAQTLEDILARQRGETLDDGFRSGNTGDPDSAAATIDQLGTLGGASNSDVFRALRYGTADVTVSARGPATGVLIQDGGMTWLEFRRGPLAKWGGIALLAVIGLLALFYLLRGRIRIEGPLTGRKILRFTSFERFGHWLLAGSFILLGVTGLITLFGRMYMIPHIGHETYATLAVVSKWIHNNVAWAFMLGLLIVIVNWTLQNIPNRYDLIWLAKGGGLFSKGSHPPAKKFNAGQKIIFWSVVVLGLSISVSGISLLFPFEFPLFAKTFGLLNDTPIPGWLGYGQLPTALAPQEEMQLAQAWHAIVAFAFMAIILAHIYLGSIGMEGAFDAVGSGEVEEEWAREHHGLWVEELEARGNAAGRTRPGAHPAE